MKKQVSLFIKGIIIGVANIIPGVSGGALAISFGLYEKIIGAVTHLFKKFKENILFLMPIGIGAVISILGLSKVLDYTLNNFEIQTILFFAGLIVGGLPALYNKIDNKKIKPRYFLAFLLTFTVVVVMTIVTPKENVVNLDILTFGKMILLFIIGIIGAATMVVPGISGSFLLMLLGYYKPLIAATSELASFDNIWHNILVLGPFGLGLISGIFLMAKLVEALLKKYPTITYYAILGFVLSSVVSIFIPITGWSFTNASIGILLFIIGCYSSYKLSKLE